LYGRQRPPDGGRAGPAMNAVRRNRLPQQLLSPSARCLSECDPERRFLSRFLRQRCEPSPGHSTTASWATHLRAHYPERRLTCRIDPSDALAQEPDSIDDIHRSAATLFRARASYYFDCSSDIAGITLRGFRSNYRWKDYLLIGLLEKVASSRATNTIKWHRLRTT
jgi:hypothetical protein